MEGPAADGFVSLPELQHPRLPLRILPRGDAAVELVEGRFPGEDDELAVGQFHEFAVHVQV